MIEFGDLQADLPAYQNTGALKVDNVLPLRKGYRALAGFQSLTTAPLTREGFCTTRCSRIILCVSKRWCN